MKKGINTKLNQYLKDRGTSKRWLCNKINKVLQKKRKRLISEQELNYWVREVPGRKMPDNIKQIIINVLGEKENILF